MDERIWTNKALALGEVITRGKATISRQFDPAAAYLISGDLGLALQNICPDAPMLGLLEDGKDAANYAIRIGRSSMLLVLDHAPGPVAGWQNAGYGVSDATDAYVAFDVAGQDAAQVLARGGVVLDAAQSLSASSSFAGIPALITRHHDNLRIWVPRAAQIHATTFFES